MIDRSAAAALAALLVLSVPSCAEQTNESTPVDVEGEMVQDESSPTGLVPSHESPEALPPGHPPVDAAAAGSIATAPPAETGAAGLLWDLPAGWIEEAPSSNIRRAQYRAPGEAGDAECVVFYFGPGTGGDPLSNAARWAGQFSQPDGRPSEQVMQTREISVGDLRVVLVEISGNYRNPMVADSEIADAMLLGAIARGPDANWFFKLTGPEETVRAQRESFESMIRSLRRGR
jgi:hypothetical protein